jgi:hypothetical protein
MPQWGANTNDESKPKNLTAEEKSRVFASERGWEITRADGTTEVLVAIRGLAGGVVADDVKLGAATIDQVFFRASSYSTGATGVVRVVYNEKVIRRTTGTLVVTQSGTTSTLTATTLGAPTTNNFVDFTFTAPATTGVVLSIGAQTISMGINDAGSTAVTSDLTIATADVQIAALAKTGSTSVTTTA